MFSKCFLHSLLVNLPLLASLKERSTHRILGYFLGAGDRDDLEEEFLVNEAARDVFALFWETGGRSFSLLPGVRLKGLFLRLSCMVAFTVTFPVAVINSHC